MAAYLLEGSNIREPENAEPTGGKEADGAESPGMTGPLGCEASLRRKPLAGRVPPFWAEPFFRVATTPGKAEIACHEDPLVGMSPIGRLKRPGGAEPRIWGADPLQGRRSTGEPSVGVKLRKCGGAPGWGRATRVGRIHMGTEAPGWDGIPDGVMPQVTRCSQCTNQVGFA
jgi:hypothetical protein